MRSIAPALLLFASATSYEAEQAVEEYSGYPKSQDDYGYTASQENYENPETSYPDYQETEESELPASQEYGSIEDDQDEDIKEEEFLAPCIEYCLIPCDVQKIYREKYVKEAGEQLTTEDLEKMCYDIVAKFEDEGKMIEEELEALLPESEAETLAFGLNVLEDKLEFGYDALTFAVKGEEMWEHEQEIEETAEPSFSTTTSTPSQTYEFELPLTKDTTKKIIETKAAQYGLAKPILPTFTSTPSETYKPELPAKKDTLMEEITTKAANAETAEPFVSTTSTSTTPETYKSEIPFAKQALTKEITEKANLAGAPLKPVELETPYSSYPVPIPSAYQASYKAFSQTLIPKQVPMATKKEQFVPRYENQGVPLTARVSPLRAAYPLRESSSPIIGQRATTTDNHASVPYYTTGGDEYNMPLTETKPLPSVERNFDEYTRNARNLPAFHQHYSYPAEPISNGDH